jgi:tRNA U34 5-carboxymethylaminomethyl modifying GTPase MnmE/TrmE
MRRLLSVLRRGARVRGLVGPLSPQDGDTIFAVATPAGVGALSVIRISGRCALQVAAAMKPLTPKAAQTLSPSQRTFAPRVATLLRFSDPKSGCAIDEGLVLYFPSAFPASAAQLFRAEELHR